MVMLHVTPAQEATDGNCRVLVRSHQVGTGPLSACTADRIGLPRRGASLARAEAGAGTDPSIVRSADSSLQHRHPASASSGEEADQSRLVLQGADAPAAGGVAAA